MDRLRLSLALRALLSALKNALRGMDGSGNGERNFRRDIVTLGSSGLAAEQPANSSLDPSAEILWREWEDFSTQPDAQGLEAGDGPQFQFTLMSYNILAQDLMQQSSELYLHCHPDILNWNYRFANLMQEFQHWDPDVSEEGDAPSCLGVGPRLFSDA